MKIEIVKYYYNPKFPEVDIFETDETDGYNAVGKLLDKVCDHVQYRDGMIVRIGTKHRESDNYYITNEFYDGFETWECDWWEGEPFIRIYGWCFIKDLRFHPCVGDCWNVYNTGRDRIWQ